MSSSTDTVRLHRVLAAPPERVYRALLEPEAMVKWLPPRGFTGKVHSMDARVGGGYKMSFTNFSSGNGDSLGSTYHKLVPVKLRHTDKFDDPNVPGEMNVTVTLRKAMWNRTLDRTRGNPGGDFEMCDLGWQESLNPLAAVVEPETPWVTRQLVTTIRTLRDWQMTFLVGTSGYSHAEWKGSFYPEKISQKKMLAYYAERFSTVEVNYTFRQIPSEKTVLTWAEQVPASFRFVLKAWQAITHFKKLQNAEKETDDFLSVASLLQERQGPILFQMPPSFKKDVSRLEAFLKHIAGRAKVAFEFRHASWLDDEVVECLRAYSAVLCVADGDDLPPTELARTADWGYVRLRDDNYTDESLCEWIRRINALKWDETYVFLMHEDTGIGPKLAARFIELAGA